MQGRLLATPPNFLYGYNGALVGQVNEGYEFSMEEERKKDEASVTEEGMAEHISTGHKNFLRNAVYFLYGHNHTSFFCTSQADSPTNNYAASVHSS